MRGIFHKSRNWNLTHYTLLFFIILFPIQIGARWHRSQAWQLFPHRRAMWNHHWEMESSSALTRRTSLNPVWFVSSDSVSCHVKLMTVTWWAAQMQTQLSHPSNLWESRTFRGSGTGSCRSLRELQHQNLCEIKEKSLALLKLKKKKEICITVPFIQRNVWDSKRMCFI